MSDLRPATLDDAGAVADLETAHTPDDPVGGAMVAYWWTHSNDGERSVRLVAPRGGAVHTYVYAAHDAWKDVGPRFGWVEVRIAPDQWTEGRFKSGIENAESWLRAENAEVAVAEVREDFERELDVLSSLGYREERRERYWELDLVARRGELLATAEQSRAAMRAQGIELLTLDRGGDPRTLRQVYELDVAATSDIPTTVPIRMSGFGTWSRNYFENPAIRKDRFWIARLGEEVVGMSLIEFPPERGVPTTSFTGTSPKHRGRGIARALKFETVVQAIEVGATRIRTDNDAANAPILHINEEMGYHRIKSHLELHRTL